MDTIDHKKIDCKRVSYKDYNTCYITSIPPIQAGYERNVLT